MTHMPRRGRSRWRWIAALTAAAVTGLTGIGILLAVTAHPGSAHADPLCDQMRREHGPYWPCINVPTYTPLPTQFTAPPTASTGDNGSGPKVGGEPGPGPGTGNGTPIIPVPGYTAPGLPGQNPPEPPQQSRQQPAPRSTGQPAPPARGDRPVPRMPTPPTPSVQQPAPAMAPGPALVPEPNPTSTDSIPTAIWLIVGAAAFTAAPARHPASKLAPLKKLWKWLRRQDNDKKDEPKKDPPKKDETKTPKGVDRGDGRDSEGKYARGNDGKSGKSAEAGALDKHERATGRRIIRDQRDARFDDPKVGITSPRRYDGLMKNKDGTYTGIEVKSGTSSKTPHQKAFDSAVNDGNPAYVKLPDGSIGKITKVIDLPG